MSAGTMWNFRSRCLYPHRAPRVAAIWLSLADQAVDRVGNRGVRVSEGKPASPHIRDRQEFKQ